MERKKLLVAGLVAALTLALPAFASANWRMEGVEIASEETITFEGTIAFEAEPSELPLVRVECDSATMTWQVEQGIRSASITSFTVDDPTTNCTVSGLIGACGEHSVDDIHLTEDATAEPYGETFHITNIDMLTAFHKEGQKEEEWCAIFEIFDNERRPTSEKMTATLDDTETIDSISLAGFLEDGERDYSVSGTLYAQPPGTFGFE